MHQIPAAITTVTRRGFVRVQFVLLALVAVAPACKLDQQGVAPPLDRIAFPASAMVDPSGEWLYVANSNSDLRYNNGTLVAVDLVAAMRDRFGADDYHPTWKLCAGPDRVRVDTDPDPCCWDYLDHQILNCDERLYVPADSTAKMGSFAAGMAFQSFGVAPSCVVDPSAPQTPAPIQTRHDCTPTCTDDPKEADVYGRLFIGVRGNSSLTYVDTRLVYDPSLRLKRDVDDPAQPGRYRPMFSCSDPKSAGHDVCTVTDTMPDSPDSTDNVRVPDEPYALALDTREDLLYVANLRGDSAHPQTGGISLFDVKRAAWLSTPTFIAPSSSPFLPDANGNFGITSLTVRTDGKIYATSRYGTNAVDVVASAPASQDVCTAPTTVAPGSDVFTTPLAGAEIRGIQFLPEGNRAFVLQRIPPALVAFDTSKDPTAFGNFPSDVLETCAAPTFLQAYDAGQGEGTRLYVTCFDAGQIYVFDPYVPRLIGVINAGRGPAGMAFPKQVIGGHALGYVIGFSANDIGVVDLQPGSDTQYHVVQHIGFPSLVPR